jgi:hypothetical protein
MYRSTVGLRPHATHATTTIVPLRFLALTPRKTTATTIQRSCRPHCTTTIAFTFTNMSQRLTSRTPHTPSSAHSAASPPAAQSNARNFSSAASPQPPTPDSAARTVTSKPDATDDAAGGALSEEEAIPASWWGRWTHESPMPPSGTAAWYAEMALIFTVFGITGSSSMYFVKPLVHSIIGIDGTFMDGPWSYRLVCLGVLMPAYSLMLVTFGTIAGRHHYFKRQALRMWGRLLPLHKLGITSKPAPVARIKTVPSSQQKPPSA